MIIVAPSHIRKSWFHHHFGDLAEDYFSGNRNTYDIDKCIARAKAYRCNTRNPKQKAYSEKMMRDMVEYLEGIRDGLDPL
jgi:hypothetical protein